ncbi:hypothetical protein E2976_01880 (plasmid) [Paracoccus yeei]|uniref:hypothetical protein n=1 Tax=Paracoccus yeei TaxID=147645 RepID=UPI003BF82D88
MEDANRRFTAHPRAVRRRICYVRDRHAQRQRLASCSPLMADWEALTNHEHRAAIQALLAGNDRVFDPGQKHVGRMRRRTSKNGL